MSKKIYTTDIKLQVVKYVVDEKHSIGEAVEHFKIPYQSMRMWIKHYEHIGITGLSIKNKKYMIIRDLCIYCKSNEEGLKKVK